LPLEFLFRKNSSQKWLLLLLGLFFISFQGYAQSPALIFPPGAENAVSVHVFIVGWSKDGKLAYWKLFPSSLPGPHLQLFVADLVSDEDSMVLAIPLDPYTSSYGHLVLDYWGPRAAEIRQILAQYSITNSNPLRLLQFPFFEKGSWTDAKLSQSPSKSGAVIEEWSVELHKTHPSLKKEVSSQKAWKSLGRKELRLEGFLSSPTENRIAILVSWLDPQDFRDFQWLGAHLSLGWVDP